MSVIQLAQGQACQEAFREMNCLSSSATSHEHCPQVRHAADCSLPGRRPSLLVDVTPATTNDTPSVSTDDRPPAPWRRPRSSPPPAHCLNSTLGSLDRFVLRRRERLERTGCRDSSPPKRVAQHAAPLPRDVDKARREVGESTRRAKRRVDTGKTPTVPRSPRTRTRAPTNGVEQRVGQAPLL